MYVVRTLSPSWYDLGQDETEAMPQERFLTIREPRIQHGDDEESMCSGEKCTHTAWGTRNAITGTATPSVEQATKAITEKRTLEQDLPLSMCPRFYRPAACTYPTILPIAVAIGPCFAGNSPSYHGIGRRQTVFVG